MLKKRGKKRGKETSPIVDLPAKKKRGKENKQQRIIIKLRDARKGSETSESEPAAAGKEGRKKKRERCLPSLS